MKTVIAFLGLFVAFTACSRSVPPEEPGKAAQALTFHIVSKDKIEGWKLVDLPGQRQQGYISPDPDLVLSQLKSVELYKKAYANPITSAEEEYSGAKITLQDEDAASFTGLSRRAVKHQVLVLLGDKPLMAPVMMVPITEPVFNIQTNGRGEKELHEALMKLVKK